MAKVSAIYPKAEEFVDATNPRGEVSAHAFINVRTLFGDDRCRRVSLGRCSTTLSDARGMVERCRSDQPQQSVMAQFIIHL